MRTVDDVRAYLEPLGLSVQTLPADTSTAASAASALATTVSSIVKSLVFFSGEQPLLVLVSGNRSVNRERLATELGVQRVRLAKPSEVVHVAGYPVGGVPPVAHEQALTTYVDRHLLDHEVVFAAAGSSHAIFAVEPQQLVQMTGGTITDATERIATSEA